MKAIHYIFLILLLCTFPASAQKKGQARLDSLLAEVPRMKQDTNGVKLLSHISTAYRQISPDNSVVYAHKAMDLAKRLKNEKAISSCYITLGAAYGEKADHATALGYLYKAQDYVERVQSKRGMAEVYLQIGHVYFGQQQIKKSEEYLERAKKLSIELKDTGKLIVVLVHFGALYNGTDPDKSMAYYLQGLELAEREGDMSTIMSLTSSVGSAYAMQRQYSKALSRYFKALKAAESFGNMNHIATINGNIGGVYLYIASDSVVVPDSLIPAGKDANLALSISYLEKALKTAEEAKIYPLIPTNTGMLSAAYKLKGDYKKAYDYLERYIVSDDSINSREQAAKIQALEAKRELDIKDKDIQIAKLAVTKKRNETGLLVAAFALLLAITLILLRNNRRQKKNNALLEKEKSRSDHLLLNILPAEVAEELKEKGDAEAKHYDEVSVLFTDFVDFTGTAEHMPPQDLVKELHECFTAFDAIMERNGLEKIKTIGDAYMAVCGLPNKDNLHAQRTVQAALEIKEFIAARNRTMRSFHIRIGVNSGPVVAGIVGVKKFAYDIWGDTVNTAARMEQHGAPGEVNISKNTYDLVKDQFRCIPRGPLTVKNKGEVEMFFVEG